MGKIVCQMASVACTYLTQEGGWRWRHGGVQEREWWERLAQAGTGRWSNGSHTSRKPNALNVLVKFQVGGPRNDSGCDVLVEKKATTVDTEIYNERESCDDDEDSESNWLGEDENL